MEGGQLLENPSSRGPGQQDSKGWHDSGIKRQQELRAKGCWAQLTKRASLRANKAISTQYPSGVQDGCPRAEREVQELVGLLLSLPAPYPLLQRDQMTKVTQQINRAAWTSN